MTSLEGKETRSWDPEQQVQCSLLIQGVTGEEDAGPGALGLEL